MTHLKNKVVLLTGGSRGIGKVAALQLGKEGAIINVCARSKTGTEDYPGTIYETADLINQTGGTAIPHYLDVTDDSQLSDVVSNIIESHGKIDVLINNAGILDGGGNFIGGDPNLLDQFYKINLRAPYVLSQLVAEKMSTTGGGIIFNISSGLARLEAARGRTGHRGPASVYGATKAALDRFAVGVAAELKEQGIAMINIYPGFTLTERYQRMFPPGKDTSRMQKPETTAKVLSFICKDPMPYAGKIVIAKELAEEHQL